MAPPNDDQEPQEKSVTDRLEAFHAAWMEMSFSNGVGFTEWWDEYFDPECNCIIRSSGNPLSKESWKKMISSDDVNYVDRDRAKLVSADSCVVFANGQAAITTCKVDLCFTYKETRNEDRALITITWHKQDGEDWKIIHFQRATGQPIPNEEE